MHFCHLRPTFLPVILGFNHEAPLCTYRYTLNFSTITQPAAEFWPFKRFNTSTICHLVFDRSGSATTPQPVFPFSNQVQNMVRISATENMPQT